MTNKEILETLMLRDSDAGNDKDLNEILQNGNSINAEMFKRNIVNWDKSEDFPIDEIKRYLRFNEWTKKDFDFENEMLIKEYLPDFFHDVFFKIKEFRSNSRNELVSTQRVFAKIMGMPMNTQDEKALVTYEYALQKFYNNSLLHKED